MVLVGLVLLSTSVLAAGTETTDTTADGQLQTENSTSDSLLDAATDRLSRAFPGTAVDLGLANGSGLDVSIATPELGISFLNLGADDESTTANVSHDAITEDVEADSDAGLCIAGLDGGDSPLNMSVDGDSGSLFVVFDDYDPDETAEPETDSAFNATRVVQECSTWEDA